ncbi:hypothetical protein IQ07DRAFT_360737 [Pyrenochaeta sp. DS3sAY3a]|nr:hypothetical protein IQ07DRAFT_360737 [Pyrenochaeta sp. DS3sAY3a]
MDSPPMATSIPAGLQAADYAIQGIREVGSRVDSRGEMVLVMNLVTDIKATLVITCECADFLKASNSPAAHKCHDDLQLAVHRLSEHLSRLADFVWAVPLRNPSGMRSLALSDGKKGMLADLKQQLCEAQRNLQSLLSSNNLRMMPALLAAVEEAVIVQNDQHVQSSATLEHIVTQITGLQTTTTNLQTLKPGAQIEELDDDYDFMNDGLTPTISEKAESSFSSDEISTLASDTTSLHSEKTLTNSSSHDAGSEISTTQSIRITTSIPYKRCDSACFCQCHKRTRYQSPTWLSAVVGTLFYSSTSTPALNMRPCNTKTCLRSKSAPSLRLTYYFPAWMMKTALVYSTWGNLGGRNSSWMIKMPREVSLKSPCWRYLHKRNEVAIKQLLVSRQMSPFDVDPNGFSVLYKGITVPQSVSFC